MANTNSAARRVLVAISLVIASLAFLPPPVHAQTNSYWSGGAGNWSDCPPGGNALWSTCPDPPNGLGYPNGNFNAVITGGPVTATSASIVNLSIGSNGSLLFPANTPASLYITGTSIANSGSIVIDSSNGMTIQGPTTLTISGGGSISMANSWFTGASGTTSTVTFQQPFSGNGEFALDFNLINQSTINATGGTLEMQPLSVVNTGTIEASSGGTLVCCPGTPISFNNTGGTIEALNGGTVQLSGSTTFTGGTLTTAGTGVIQASGDTILNTLTNSGMLQAQNTTVLEGTVTNSGTIQVTSNGVLDLEGATTLTGSGSLNLSGSAELGQYNASGSLTTQQLIEGAGTIYDLPLINQSTINANSNGNTLYLVGGTTTNTALIEASNGGILDVATTVNNTGGTIEAQTGSTVIIGGNNAGTIEGGTLTTSGTGVIESENGVLDGTVNIPTNAGTFTADNDDLYIQGTINNTGTITLSGTSFVILNEASTLTGSGKLVMGSSSASILGSGLALTNQSTIEGAGYIEPTQITNSGTILANSASPLGISPGSSGFTNTGVLSVSSGSTLTVDSPFNSLSSAGTLSTGTYAVTGTLGLPGAVVTNSASITLTGAAAEILDTVNNSNALGAIASNGKTGTLSLQSGQSLSTTKAFANAGTTTIGASSAFNVGTTFTQKAGTTTVDGTLTAPSGMTIEKGSLLGKGTLAAAVTSSGATVTAGDSSTQPGVLTISGSYTQQAKGGLDIYIGGTSTGSFGNLAVSNGVSLDGKLTIKLLKGFVPAVGDSFTIVTGSAVTGTFNSVKGTSINSNKHFEMNYTSTAVTLTVASGA